MSIDGIILLFFIISALLFILSFFVRTGKTKEEELEQQYITLVGEMYMLKKKMGALEEELLTGTGESLSPGDQLTAEAQHYYNQGLSLEEISQAMNVHTDEVKHLLKQ